MLTRPVLIAVQNYGWLALLDISYSAILTVFLPVPISAGGLNLLPPTVGVVFGTMGLVDGLLLLVLFPPILKRFGHKKIMTAAMANFWLIFACFPWMHEIAKAHPVEPGTLDSRVWAVMGLLVVIGGVIFMGYSAFTFNFHSIYLELSKWALISRTGRLYRLFGCRCQLYIHKCGCSGPGASRHNKRLRSNGHQFSARSRAIRSHVVVLRIHDLPGIPRPQRLRCIRAARASYGNRCLLLSFAAGGCKHEER